MEVQKLELNTRTVEVNSLGLLARNVFIILAMEHNLSPTKDQADKDLKSHDWCRGFSYAIEMFCAAKGMPVFLEDENITRVARLLKLAYKDHNMAELVVKHKDAFMEKYSGS